MKIIGLEIKRWHLIMLGVLAFIGVSIKYNLWGKYLVEKDVATGGKEFFKSVTFVPGLIDTEVLSKLREFADNGILRHLSDRDAAYVKAMGESLYETPNWFVRAMRPIAELAGNAIDFVRKPLIGLIYKTPANSTVGSMKLVDQPGWRELAGIAAAGLAIGGFLGLYKTLWPHGFNLSPKYNALKQNRGSYNKLKEAI